MIIKHKTGGRRKGTRNKATAKREAEIVASGLTPLDYLLAVMRDETRDERERLDAAKAAAPYVHPKLAAVASISKDEMAEQQAKVGPRSTGADHLACLAKRYEKGIADYAASQKFNGSINGKVQ